MKEVLHILNIRYETAINSKDDFLFYRNVYEYIDWIFNDPKLKSIVREENVDHGTKYNDIWKEKTNDPKVIYERASQIYKMEYKARTVLAT